MRDTEAIIKDFVQKLRQTQEYRRYEEMRRQVQEHPGLREKINEYRIKNYELQKSGEGLFEKIDAFVKEYETFRADPVVDGYLEAELAVCRMLQEVSVQVAEAIDLDILLPGQAG